MKKQLQANPTRHGYVRLASVLASSAVLMTGCANMATTASNGSSFGTPAATISGVVHGGNQSVSGAAVNLYMVGQSGVGSSGTLLATTTTDASGNFSFAQTATPASGTATQPTALGGNAYNCGNQADPLLYVESRGGNTTGNASSGSTNSAAVFLAPIGFCSVSANAKVFVSEVTTAATVAAAAQFINPSTELIGNDGIAPAYQAINHSFQTVSNMVNQTSGQAVTALARQGGTTSVSTQTYNVSGVTISVVPNAAKLNTIANILSACVNQSTSTGPGCSTLFANAVPPFSAAQTSQPGATFPTASDTLLAALYMFINPTDSSTTNRSNLLALSTPSGPYQPTIGAVPTDWTLPILYSTANSCDTNAAASKFFSNPYGLAIDLSGNIWVSNLQSSNGALVELSNIGTPAACVTVGGTNTTPSGTSSTVGSSTTVVDDAFNIWYGDTGASALKQFNPVSNTILTYTTASPVLSVTADGADNIFFSVNNGGTGQMYKIRSGAVNTTTSPQLLISNIIGPAPNSIFPDTAGDVWAVSGSSFVTQAAATTGGSAFLNGYNSTQFAVTSPTTSLQVGPANGVYISSGGSASLLTILATSGASYVTKTGFPTATNAGGINLPTGLALDGARNSWFANNTFNNTNGISVVATTGTALSASGPNGGFQKGTGYFNGLRNILIDQSGNVWTTNDGSASAITEVVGAAVPIYQPYSYGITQGRFQMIP